MQQQLLPELQQTTGASASTSQQLWAQQFSPNSFLQRSGPSAGLASCTSREASGRWCSAFCTCPVIQTQSHLSFSASFQPFTAATCILKVKVPLVPVFCAVKCFRKYNRSWRAHQVCSTPHFSYGSIFCGGGYLVPNSKLRHPTNYTNVIISGSACVRS